MSDERSAFSEGYEAASKGLPRECPYPEAKGPGDYDLWCYGYDNWTKNQMVDWQENFP